MANIENILQKAESEGTKPSPLDIDQDQLLEFRNQAILSNLMSVSILTNRLLQEGPWKSTNELAKSVDQHALKPKMTPSYRPPFLNEDSEDGVLRRKKQLYYRLVNHIRLLDQLFSHPADAYKPVRANLNSGQMLTRPIPSAAFYRSLVNQNNRAQIPAARTNATPVPNTLNNNPNPQNQAIQQNDVTLAPALPGFDDAHSHAPHIAVPKPSANQAKLDEVDYKGDIPEKYICPLSGAIMTTPVENPEKGLPTVEKAWIEAEIERTGKNPYNNQPLSQEDLQTNKALESEIADFVDQIVPEEVDSDDNLEMGNSGLAP